MGLSLMLDVPGVWLRNRIRQDGHTLDQDRLDERTVETYRMLGADWLASLVARGDHSADTSLPSRATLGRLCRFLDADPDHVTREVARRLGVELTSDPDTYLPAYVVAFLLADDRDEPTPVGIPVRWGPEVLPDHLDRVSDHARRSTSRAAQLAGLDLADADLVWVTALAWEHHRDDPIGPGAVHDVIPFPAGVVVFAEPVTIDDTAVIAISWRHDAHSYDVTLQVWTTTTFDDPTSSAAGTTLVDIGLHWDPGHRFTVSMDDALTRTRADGVYLDALVRQWQILQHLPAHAPTHAETSTPPPHDRTRTSHRTRTPDITRWRTSEHPTDPGTRERRPNDAPAREEKVWWVRGHWRWARSGPGGLERRRVWVRRHLKGHGALEPRRRVYILDA